MALPMYDPRFYPEITYGGISRCDGAIQFYSRINAVITSDSLLVDFGCGRGAYLDDPVHFRRNLRNFRGRVAKVIGLDVDPAAKENPAIDEFHLLTRDREWPLADGSVDLIICDGVVEHLQQPAHLFSQARRTLKPGGYLFIVTTNVLSYVGVAARLIPNRLHSQILARIQPQRKKEDVFPTVYRCNTIPAVQKQMKRHGFRAAVFGFDGGPGYLAFSTVAYALGFVYQQLAPSLIRPIIMAVGQKQSSN
jgi:SAM-dependent methyltransferase